MGLLLHWLVVAASILLTAKIVPGIKVEGWGAAFLAAFVLGALNIFLKPVLIIFTLPATILTLGLFLFVVNALVLMAVGKLTSGMRVEGFLPALLGSILISLVTTAVEHAV
jgi:putative membrane protein